MALHYEPEFRTWFSRWWGLNVRTELKKFPKIKKHNSNYNVLHIENGTIKLGKFIEIDFISHRIESIEFAGTDITKKYLNSQGMNTEYVAVETVTIKHGDDTITLPQPKDIRRQLRKIYRWCYKFENTFLELYNIIGASLVDLRVKTKDWKIYIGKKWGEYSTKKSEKRVWIHFINHTTVEIGSKVTRKEKIIFTPRRFDIIDIEGILYEVNRYLDDDNLNSKEESFDDSTENESNWTSSLSMLVSYLSNNGSEDED